MADLTVVLLDAVREHRRLSGDERRAIKTLVDERVRELRPYMTDVPVPGGRHGWNDVSVSDLEGMPLSKRESEVMVELMLGRHDREIAVEFGLSAATVRTYVQKALRKLGARNRVHAATLMLAHGLVAKEEVHAS
jgi:DNA-binding NarL/FixJ family response regulator